MEISKNGIQNHSSLDISALNNEKIFDAEILKNGAKITLSYSNVRGNRCRILYYALVKPSLKSHLKVIEVLYFYMDAEYYFALAKLSLKVSPKLSCSILILSSCICCLPLKSSM